MARSKDIGTWGETATKNYLQERGFSKLEAHRNILAGAKDEGDVWLRHPVRGLIVFEVKAGNAAKNASYEQSVKWLQEAETERANANGAFGFLVQQRSGFGNKRTGGWWAFLPWHDFLTLSGYWMPEDHPHAGHIMRIPLEALVDLIG